MNLENGLVNTHCNQWMEVWGVIFERNIEYFGLGSRVLRAMACTCSGLE